MKARRDQRKAEYEKYLNSQLWAAIRKRILKRDRHRCRAYGCEARATVVHHARYPKVLGQEKDDWLYAMCVPCHDSIHRLMPKMTLRKATEAIIHPEQPPKKKKPSPPLVPHEALVALQERFKGGHVSTRKAKNHRPKLTLREENDRLHEVQQRAKRRRENQ